MGTAQMVLEYLRWFTSWSIVVPALILAAMLLFKPQLKRELPALFARIAELRIWQVFVKIRPPKEQPEVPEESRQLKLETQPSATGEQPAPTGTDPAERLRALVNQDPAIAYKHYEWLRTSYFLERALNSIYGTQIRLLLHLRKRQDHGEKYTNLDRLYNEFVRLSKSTTTTMSDYLRWLRESRLTEHVGQGADEIVKITPFGVSLLDFIRTQYPGVLRPF